MNNLHIVIVPDFPEDGITYICRGFCREWFSAGDIFYWLFVMAEHLLIGLGKRNHHVLSWQVIGQGTLTQCIVLFAV